MFVTKLGHFPIVLGFPWLRIQDFTVQCTVNLVNYGSHYYTTSSHNGPVRVYVVTEEPPDPVSPPKSKILEPHIPLQQAFRGSIAMINGSLFV